MIDPAIDEVITYLLDQDRNGIGPARFTWSNAIKELALQNLRKDIEIAEMRAKMFDKGIIP